jgi:protein phosphatase
MQVLCLARSEMIYPTKYDLVDTGDVATWGKTLAWWEQITADSSEGLVVKPMPFVPTGRRGLAQPALKCRTQEHLRLVYGPRYDARGSLEALRSRDALLRRRNKHRRILRQFALSMEALNRFVQRNPLEAVHECLLGILAQEVAPTMPT